MDKFNELLEQLQRHLDCSVQNWFLGAGVSVESNIPLMQPLTCRVERLLEDNKPREVKEIYDALKQDLPDDSHIEHVLSHIGDLLALADRSASKQCQFAGKTYSILQFTALYRALITYIGATIRYGYKPADPASGTEELIGTAETPIVDIDHHRLFLRALFATRANLERRSRFSFFTVNYDTLLEDALNLERRRVVDGFSGGAMGFWNPTEEFETQVPADGATYKLYKLHGSVDWYQDADRGLVRSRYGVKYLADPAQILIYPQATKYVETQKDPFATLFLGLRQALSLREDNVLAICGYSFGDAHINAEVEGALKEPANKTTMIAFVREQNGHLPGLLRDWLESNSIGSKIFVASQCGLYNGRLRYTRLPNDELAWWSFTGLTEFLKSGVLI